MTDRIDGTAKRPGRNWAAPLALSAVSLLASAATVAGEPETHAAYNTYGSPGVIDMPSAYSRPDGELGFTVSSFAGQTRNTLTFQVTPRLSTSLRYSSLQDLNTRNDTLYDRSLSLHYRLVDEGYIRPAVAVGLNDILGTGVYSSEYIVASKTLRDALRITGGLGWGRLAGEGEFRNPLSFLSDRFEERGPREVGFGGRVDTGNWFRGDAALFAGIEWQATERLGLALEYSSDAYAREQPTAFSRDSSINVEARYSFNEYVDVSAYYLYGSEVGLQISTAINPKDRPNSGGIEAAPPPVLPRSAAAAGQLGWPETADTLTSFERRLSAALGDQGIVLHGYTLGRNQITVEFENESYSQTAQALGRTARVITRVAPASVERIAMVPVVNGLPGSQVVMSRRDLEAFEFRPQAAALSLNNSSFEEAIQSVPPADARYPRLRWNLKPYLTPSFFDPDAPVRADIGLELGATLQPARGLEFSGAVRKRLVGNLDESTRESTSVLPRVRSDFNIYDREGDTKLIELTGAYYFKPGANLYGRVTAGYLEPMFGGVSTELLWKRHDSRLALGIEANYVRQRDFNQLFSFRNYETFTGHVSAYYQLESGYHFQVDVGQYLAGDVGATFSFDREFDNGWRVGAFATFTDVSYDDFGEGSFDKGLRVTVPIDWLSGGASREQYEATIRPVQRDGGARLSVNDRLYERVRDVHEPQIVESWGRFWR